MPTSNHISCEIHFHQQHEVSVFVESDISGQRELDTEAILFALFAIRQISNLDSAEFTDPLAELLLQTTACLPVYRDSDTVSGVTITPYQGCPGRKRFLATAIASEDAVQSFNISVKGFGLLARGVGYYAPMSVLALLRSLLRKRQDSSRQQRLLAYIAERIGQLQLQRQISLAGQGPLALCVLSEGKALVDPECDEAAEESEILAGIGRRVEEMVDARLSLYAITNESGFRTSSFRTTSSGGRRLRRVLARAGCLSKLLRKPTLARREGGAGQILRN